MQGFLAGEMCEADLESLLILKDFGELKISIMGDKDGALKR